MPDNTPTTPTNVQAMREEAIAQIKAAGDALHALSKAQQEVLPSQMGVIYDEINRGCSAGKYKWQRDDAPEPAAVIALRECLPDLEHYAATHGPGPDRRLENARAALALHPQLEDKA